MINQKVYLNPKLFDEDIDHQKTAQKIHLSVDSLTGNQADALITIPDLRYEYTNNILYKSQFLGCGPKGS